MGKALKTLRIVISAIYAAVSGYFIYIFIQSFIFSISKITVGNSGASVGIIGGAGAPTLRFLISRYIVVIALLVISVSLILFNVLNLINAITDKGGKRLKTILAVWVLANLLFFIFIPPQTYVMALYSVLRPLSDTVFTFLLSPSFLFPLSSIITAAVLIAAIVKESKNEKV